MRNSSIYRAKAAELAEMARNATDPELAAVCIDLAMDYRALATWVEARERRRVTWSPAPPGPPARSPTGQQPSPPV